MRLVIIPKNIIVRGGVCLRNLSSMNGPGSNSTEAAEFEVFKNKVDEISIIVPLMDRHT
jgi:hypothetical protein